MEKTTKKKKKAKALRRRIGIIAVGGLSLVLTICLSVGATLAWFAGSTWSDNQMYMGGPVYVEMAGVGSSGKTAGGDGAAQWKGGAGNLTIQAATTRKTGTANPTNSGDAPSNILLPGQKFEIYSQARVFSTAYTDGTGSSNQHSTTSGANTTNTNANGTVHKVNKGRITSTTSSVLRARFSVSVEFDPTVGFNNFTGEDYVKGYPVKSGNYLGEYVAADETEGAVTIEDVDCATKVSVALSADNMSWTGALNVTSTSNPTKVFKNHREDLDAGSEGDGGAAAAGTAAGAAAYPLGSRRDTVETDEEGQLFVSGLGTNLGTGQTYKDITSDAEGELTEIRAGEKKSIYAWKFVSEDVYKAAAEVIGDDTDFSTYDAEGKKYAKMSYPFNGQEKTTYGTNGYYGVWILDSNGKLTESDAFYKARCNAYIDTYVEEYMTEYDEIKERTIGDSLASLENSLNEAFVNLVNDSSDAIAAGKVLGVTNTNGKLGYVGEAADDGIDLVPQKAAWLYIDPKIGNDTNTNELSTSTGGWWYLVETDGAGSSKDGTVKYTISTDSVTDGVNTPTNQAAIADYTGKVEGTDYFTKESVVGEGTSQKTYEHTSRERLKAKLFEIDPLNASGDPVLNTNGTKDVTKVVSVSFPFVNGTSALPGDALTNIFANAKITVQISFQALQAFFPYSTTIDSMTYANPLLGTAKALNIENAIPIYNEAFDYQESLTGTISGL